MKFVEASDFFQDQSSHSTAIVSLMNQNGYLNWDHHFFKYHYIDYPLSVHSFLLLSDNDKIVGHISFRDNPISLPKLKSCWCMHALIDKSYRNLVNFIYLLRNAQTTLIKIGYNVIFAMPNDSAAEIYSQCIGWNDIGYVNFSLTSTIPYSASRNKRPLYFKKSVDWWKWRLNTNNEPTLVSQSFPWNGLDVSQLLYVSPSFISDPSLTYSSKKNQPVCVWDHQNYTDSPSWWSCRFMCKLLSPYLDSEILNIRNWHIDMIDSDAFRCSDVTIN